jgi:hypothetical protein
VSLKEDEQHGQSEALKQIQIINDAIDASHKFFISGPLLVAYGLSVLCIPAIELPTHLLHFGGGLSTAMVGLLHVAIYSALFLSVRFVVDKIWSDETTSAAHPILIQALTFHNPVFVSVCGAIFVLAYADQLKLAGAIVFMMIGILFHIYGRLSNRLMLWFSWSYIYLGILFGVLTSDDRPYLWLWFDAYLGLSFILLGFKLRREKGEAWKTQS